MKRLVVPQIGCAGRTWLPSAEVEQRSPEEVRRLIEVYPPEWRRWCDGPENGGCACRGCVRWPAPSTVSRDPEGSPFPNPSDRLAREEVDAYLASKRD